MKLQPDFSKLNHDVPPEQIALDGLRKAGLEEQRLINVDQLAERLQIRVERLDPKSMVSRLSTLNIPIKSQDLRRIFGGMFVPANILSSQPTALILQQSDPWKERFILAHEIAHMLDQGQEQQICNVGIVEPALKTAGNAYVKWQRWRAEHRADQIARALLMPPQHFVKDVCNHTLFDLAKRYAVPLEEIVDYTITLDICPMARLICWYDRSKQQLFNNRELSVRLSSSADTKILCAALSLRNNVNALHDIFDTWIRTKGRSAAKFNVERQEMCVTVYNDLKRGRLFILITHLHNSYCQRLSNGLLAPLRVLD